VLPIALDLSSCKSCLLDGEVLICGDDGIPVFNRLRYGGQADGQGGDQLPVQLGAHDHHVMLDEGAAQDGLVSGIDRLGEVEPGDLDPGVSRERRDGQRHGMTLHASSLSRGR
jgi:hypothetical protein